MDKTPEQIAAGLRPSRKAALLSDTRRGRFSSAVCAELIAAGLIDDLWFLTNLGDEVRAILEAKP